STVGGSSNVPVGASITVIAMVVVLRLVERCDSDDASRFCRGVGAWTSTERGRFHAQGCVDATMRKVRMRRNIRTFHGAGARPSVLVDWLRGGGPVLLDPDRELGTRIQAKFPVDVGDVGARGVVAHEKGVRDLPVREPLAHKHRDLPLAFGQAP